MLVVGHRGCRGLLPENTIDGFIEAIRLGVDAVELDIIVSRDKEIVVSHEPFMSRITCLKPDGTAISIKEDEQYNLFKMSYKEIQAFDCGLKEHPKFPNQIKIPAYKPLLVEAIIACEAFSKQHQMKQITYVVEIKSKPDFYNVFFPEPKGYVQLILKALKFFQLGDRLILKSFDVNILNEIKRQSPKTKTSLLINKEESIDKKLQKVNFTPEILGPYYALIDPDNIKKYQQKGFEVYPWTINESDDLIKIKRYGVDAIITDYPNKLLEMFSFD